MSTDTGECSSVRTVGRNRDYSHHGKKYREFFKNYSSNLHSGVYAQRTLKWNLIICRKMGGTRGLHVEWNTPEAEQSNQQILLKCELLIWKEGFTKCTRLWDSDITQFAFTRVNIFHQNLCSLTCLVGLPSSKRGPVLSWCWSEYYLP